MQWGKERVGRLERVAWTYIHYHIKTDSQWESSVCHRELNPEICDNLPRFDEIYYRASLVVQSVKNLPTVWGTRVQTLGWEDPLEKGMATHSSILAWRIPWTEEPGKLQSMVSQKSCTRLSV